MPFKGMAFVSSRQASEELLFVVWQLNIDWFSKRRTGTRVQIASCIIRIVIVFVSREKVFIAVHLSSWSISLCRVEIFSDAASFRLLICIRLSSNYWLPIPKSGIYRNRRGSRRTAD